MELLLGFDADAVTPHLLQAWCRAILSHMFSQRVAGLFCDSLAACVEESASGESFAISQDAVMDCLRNHGWPT